MANSAFREIQAELRSQVQKQWPYTCEALQRELIQQHYYLDEVSSRKLANYLALGKPVGLRGEPGVGKSELPERIAQLLNARLIDIECHSQLETMDIGIAWNGFKQIVDAQSGRLQEEPFSMAYLTKTPLVDSLLSEEPVVVRVDEVDKLNEHTSNFFLRFLDKKELIVHDLEHSDKVLRARAPIYVFLTSNDYQELDPAMMRRIAWIELAFPSESDLIRIIEAKTSVPNVMARRIAFVVNRLRGLQLQKKPSVGEVLDWTRALILETEGRLTLDAIRVTLGLLLKYREDERKGWEEIQTWVSQL